MAFSILNAKALTMFANVRGAIIFMLKQDDVSHFRFGGMLLVGTIQ